ncbi:hypothetical protein SAMN04487934_105180 [Eubacterium ruminantium]|nr:hypothetical protein SAMN04487934_105180 [Eubacterium ruminantium]
MTKIHSINSNQLYIAQNAEVSLKLAGNTAQVTFTAGKNRKCPIKNLSKDEFVDLSTCEVKKRRHSENRFQSPKSVRKSKNSLMDLIRCNAINHSNCKCGYIIDYNECRLNWANSRRICYLDSACVGIYYFMTEI